MYIPRDVPFFIDPTNIQDSDTVPITITVGGTDYTTVNSTVVRAVKAHSPTIRFTASRTISYLKPFPTDYLDPNTVYVDIQVGTAEVVSGTDVATVYVDIQPYVVAEFVTIYLNIQTGGGECFSRFHLDAEGEAFVRWINSDQLPRWANDQYARWSASIAGVEPGC